MVKALRLSFFFFVLSLCRRTVFLGPKTKPQSKRPKLGVDTVDTYVLNLYNELKGSKTCLYSRRRDPQYS